MISGCCNGLAFCDFSLTAQTPGITAVACCAAGFCCCVPDLRAACMIFCIHCTVRLLTGFTYSLFCTGCSTTAVGYLFIGRVTVSTLMPVAFCIMLPFGLEVMRLQFAIELTAGCTFGLLCTGGFAACMISGCCNGLAFCDFSLTAQTPGITAVACLAAGFCLSIPDLRAACVVGCIQFAVALTANLTDCLEFTGGSTADMVICYRNFFAFFQQVTTT